MGRPLLELDACSKVFGGARALANVSLAIGEGEVHALVGHNGSGKSTLIKILAGYHAPSPGARLRVAGRDVPLPLPPGGSRAAGLSFVHQHLALLPGLSVTENLHLAPLSSGAIRRIRWRQAHAAAVETLARYGLAIEPRMRVEHLPQADRALVAVVRAAEDLRRSSGGILVLDEPTAFLPADGVARLLDVVRRAVAAGNSALFVSHHIDEVLAVAHRITVLRDGSVVASVDRDDATEQELVRLMIGAPLAYVRAPRGPRRQGPRPRDRPPRLRLEGLRGTTVKGVSLEVAPGEVVGLTGLLGSGFSELPHLVFGSCEAFAGGMQIDGEEVKLCGLTPAQAIAHGVALVPADRQVQGGIGSLSVADNISVTHLERFGSRWRLARRRVAAEAADAVVRFGVLPPDPHLDLSALSGGNQQKVMLAKWLADSPRVLLLDEPTQGVDVAAREQIHSILAGTAENGAAILCASADHEHLALVCDRVLIFAGGRPRMELVGGEITKDAIAHACLSVSATSSNAKEMR